MTQQNLIEKLKELALAATPGPWQQRSDFGMDKFDIVGNVDGEDIDGMHHSIFTEVCEISDSSNEIANRDYILAVSPEIILALLKERDNLLSAIKEESRKFQQETLRTSEQAVLLQKWQSRAEYHSHQRSPWAVQCDWCELTRDTHELLNRPISSPPLPAQLSQGSAGE